MFWHCLGFFRFLERRESSLPSRARQGASRNILIVGSLGVGKSSLVNMLTGKAVAPVSNDIGIAHPPIVEYPVSLSEIAGDSSSLLQNVSDPDLVLRFFDTLGLEHRPSPWGAITARVRRSGGVDVVVYSMRRGRLSPEQVTHLRNVWKTYCRGDVPLLLVVGGIDFRRGSTEKWWEMNAEELKNTVQVGFAEHLCLNTWDRNHPSWKHQAVGYEEAQKRIRDLVIRHCKVLHSVNDL